MYKAGRPKTEKKLGDRAAFLKKEPSTKPVVVQNFEQSCADLVVDGRSTANRKPKVVLRTGRVLSDMLKSLDVETQNVAALRLSVRLQSIAPDLMDSFKEDTGGVFSLPDNHNDPSAAACPHGWQPSLPLRPEQQRVVSRIVLHKHNVGRRISSHVIIT